MIELSKLPAGGGDQRKIRVVIVDDSIVVRGLFSRWLAEEADIEVVGIHRNGLEALRNIGVSRPDVALLDIEMPEMDGLTALPLLLQKSPDTRILIVSSLSERGADITLKCLMRGASEYLTKPSSMGNGDSPTVFRASLLTRIRALGGRAAGGVPAVAAPQPVPGLAEPGPGETGPHMCWTRKTLAPEVAAAVRRAVKVRPEVLLIGASTGGPQAIAALLDSLGPVLDDVPVVIAQHMPALFTQMFAAHLKRQLCTDTFEIDEGDVLKPGSIYICRGGQNTEIRRRAGGLAGVVRPAGADMKATPSIDLMFASAAREVGAGVVALALTGIGGDVASGVRAVAQAGGVVMAQDEGSSIVWGIPGEAARTGVCTLIDDIPGLAEGIRLAFAAR